MFCPEKHQNTAISTVAGNTNLIWNTANSYKLLHYHGLCTERCIHRGCFARRMIFLYQAVKDRKWQ